MKKALLFLCLIVCAIAGRAAVAPITGSLSICDGSTTLLASATPGGTWSSSTVAVAAISSTGVVAGMSSGTSVITYTVGAEIATAVVTVNPIPAMISGTLLVCDGHSTSLSSASGGGSWTSSVTPVAVVDPATGVVTGVTPGTSTITYTAATGCYRTVVVTVTALPSSISGVGSVCEGGTATLGAGTPGGSWSSSDPSIASVASTGVYIGYAAGTATITYGLPSGCYTTYTVTVNPMPSPITGPLTVCAGLTTTLGSATAGGIWSSSNMTVASVGSSSGVVMGTAGGTAHITYALPTGCVRVAVVTVNGLPAISGVATVCTGFATTFSIASSGGTWTSGDITKATVDAATGVVTGVAAGTAMISYTAGTCGTATRIVTVTAALPPVTGTAVACVGATSVLSNSAPGGSWMSGDAAVANVGSSGIVAGVAAGTATISYATATCPVVTAIFTVHPLPAAITGSLGFCVGLTTTLSSATAGGTWSSSNAAISVVSGAGVATGISVGTARLTYTLPTGCLRTVTVTVNATAMPISGTTTLCVGGVGTVTTSSLGGSWSSSHPSVLTITSAAVVTGVAPGTSVVSYTMGSGCAATRIITVNAVCSGTPAAGSAISSAPFVCPGGTTTLSLVGTGTDCGLTFQWQSSPDMTAWTNISGATSAVRAVSPTATTGYRCIITCGSFSATSAPVTVVATSTIGSAAPVADTFCNTAHFRVTACGVASVYSVTTTYGDGSSITSGMSASAGLAVANFYHTYSLPGIYTITHILYNAGVATDSISYTYTSVPCNTLPVSLYNDVNGNCIHDAGDYYNTLPLSVKVDSNGVAIDTVITTSGFYYSALGGPGTIYRFTVVSLPAGRVVSCPSTGALLDTIDAATTTYAVKKFGLSCTSSPSFDLAVTSSIVTNMTTQVTTIIVSNPYCFAVTPVVTMVFSPKYSYVAGAFPCYYSNPLPTIVVGNVATWELSSLAAGTSRTIMFYRQDFAFPYSMPGDTVQSTISVAPTAGDVNPANNINIRVDTVRASYDPNDIAVMPEGNVLPCTKLQYTVRFENQGNDTARDIHVLDTLSSALDPTSIEPVVASHAMHVSVTTVGPYKIAKFDFPGINLLDSSYHELCQGSFIFNINVKPGLTDGTTIMNRVGIYFEDNPVVMTNSVTNTIGINPIIGPSSVCVGDTIALTNASAGGTWATAGSAISLLPETWGSSVEGVATGTAVVSYTVANSCASRTATKVVTVNTIPAAGPISGAGSLCAGGTATLSGAASGGSWSSGSSTIATISATGIVTAVSPGTSAISYTTTNVCGSATTTAVITVDAPVMPAVAAIPSPAGAVCTGSPVSFSPTTAYAGSAPLYVWKKNGIIVTTAPSYTYTPVHGDIISCLLLSTYACRLADTVSSADVAMVVDPVYVPAVSVTASPGTTVAPGETVTFNSGVTGAGPSPAYQWYINGAAISGATDATYTTATIADGDSVSCMVTGSGACHVVSFDHLIMHVSSGVAHASHAESLSLYPNPNSGQFVITADIGGMYGAVEVEIVSTLGIVVYKAQATPSGSRLIMPLSLPDSLPPGVYTVRLHANGERYIKRFILNR